MANILITGVNGFIGKHLAAALAEKGHCIIGIDMNEQATVPVDKYIICRLGTDNLLEKIKPVKQLDAIVHLAAELDAAPWVDSVIKTNCVGTQGILQLAEIYRCRKFIYMSSIMLYRMPALVPITEDHPIDCPSVYHLTKFFGEMMVLLAARASKFDFFIFRLTSPIGKNMLPIRFLPVTLDCCQHNHDIVLYGSGSRIQNYIDVRDICTAIISALNSTNSGIYNLAGEQSYSNNQVANLCLNICRSESSIIYRGEDIHENEKWVVDISKLRHNLGFSPQYALTDSIKWLIGG